MGCGNSKAKPAQPPQATVEPLQDPAPAKTLLEDLQAGGEACGTDPKSPAACPPSTSSTREMKKLLEDQLQGLNDAGLNAAPGQPLRIAILGLVGFQGPAATVAPCCVCEIPGKPHSKLQTAAVSAHAGVCEELNWNHEADLSDYSPGDSLVFSIWDGDSSREECLLGSVLLHSTQLREGFDGELRLGELGGAKGSDSSLNASGPDGGLQGARSLEQALAEAADPAPISGSSSGGCRLRVRVAAAATTAAARAKATPSPFFSLKEGDAEEDAVVFVPELDCRQDETRCGGCQGGMRTSCGLFANR